LALLKALSATQWADAGGGGAARAAAASGRKEVAIGCSERLVTTFAQLRSQVSIYLSIYLSICIYIYIDI